MVFKLTYFASCDLKSTFEHKSLLPYLKIMTVTGINPESFKVINGQYNSLACYGELKLAYCITQSIPCLDSRRVGAWCQTRNIRDNNIQRHQTSTSFNEGIELPLPYNSLYDYNGIAFVLCSTFTDSNGVHDQFLAGCHHYLYNSKKAFRNGIYELELHCLHSFNLRNLDDALNIILTKNLQAKPKDMDELNRYLKVNRKQIRGELIDTPLDPQTLPLIERKIEELKRDSGRTFLSVKFEFSRSYPCLYLPVIFERPVMNQTDQWPERWNPVDEMYFKMTRNIRTIKVDRERKPNKETLARLIAIIDQPYGEALSELDGDLIWKFRFFLATKFPETVLPKFLLSVRWEYTEQVSQAIELLQVWPTVSSENVLELLTRQFPHRCCRRFAVSRLKEANDEDIQLYLYQLVQALRYESLTDVQSKRRGKRSTAAQDKLPWKTDLTGFLIQRASKNFELANFLYWFLQLEANEETPSTPETRKMFDHVLARFLNTLKHGNKEQKLWYDDIMNQQKFVNNLHTLLKSVQDDSSKRTRKIDLLREKLQTDGPMLTQFNHPLPFPVDPKFYIASIDAESANLFKSTTQPALLTLVSPDGSLYRVIFKIGDDLRQDQLVLQMIQLMDVVLKKEQFDLQLTPYKVLAVSCRHGFIQFVEGVPLAGTRQEGSILSYLQNRAPSSTDPLGIQQKVLDTYIRSCAGYCVITYLLGVGDRHMENIMLTPEGQLFHIDFGFILGNDPKPMAPEVRLTKAMIEAMGGPQTQLFNEFGKICVTAFLNLRRHANLFLTLFSLVNDAGIHDIARDPIKACEFLKDRFCLDQTDEKAANRFASRLTESIKAIMPEIIERFHSVFQYMRN